MSTPDGLACTVSCPLNPGNLKQVVAFVRLWRQLAAREAAWPWQYSMARTDSPGFQSTAPAGRTRPWVNSGECNVTLGQQMMAQVAGPST